MGAGLKRLGDRRRRLCGPGGAGIAFIGVDFFANGEQTYSQPLWTWMSVGDFNIGFNLVLDGLSLTMLGGHWCGFPYSHVRLLVYAR